MVEWNRPRHRTASSRMPVLPECPQYTSYDLPSPMSLARWSVETSTRRLCRTVHGINVYGNRERPLKMASTTTEKTLEMLRMFAQYGLPDQIVSDNGPQFSSSEFASFMKNNGVKHIRVAPYHLASNGAAERFVQTFKQSMKASKNDLRSLKDRLYRFQLQYLNIPNSATGVTPAELFMRRPLKTRLNLLRPHLQSKVMGKQADQKN